MELLCARDGDRSTIILGAIHRDTYRTTCQAEAGQGQVICTAAQSASPSAALTMPGEQMGNACQVPGNLSQDSFRGAKLQ